MFQAKWSRPDQLTDRIIETPKKMFFLDANRLDGTSLLFDDSVQLGYGGGQLSDGLGNMSPPVPLSVSVPTSKSKFLLIAGNDKLDVYPTVFDIDLRLQGVSIHSGRITNGTLLTYIDLGKEFVIDEIVLSVVKINQPNTALKVLEVNVYSGIEVVGVTTNSGIHTTTSVTVTGIGTYQVASSDLARLSTTTYIDSKEMDVTDVQELGTKSEGTKPNDIHQALKRSARFVGCKVIVRFTRMGEEATSQVVASHTVVQPVPITNLINGIREASVKYAYAGYAKANGYHPVTATTQDAPVTFNNISNSTGALVQPLIITTTFSPRYLNQVILAGNAPDDNYPVDFQVKIYDDKGRLKDTKTVVGNRNPNWQDVIDVADAAKTEHIITKISQPNRMAQVQEVFGSLVLTYYNNEIIYADILEETGAATTEVGLGKMSSNQLSLSLLNQDGAYNYNNARSPFRNLLRSNREIQVFYGTEVDESEITWTPMGTFWSSAWQTSYDTMQVTTVADDRLSQLTGLHQLAARENVSVGQLITSILVGAGVPEKDIIIDPALNSVIMAYAFFPRMSNARALQELCSIGYFNIYATRANKIKAVYADPRKDIPGTSIVATLRESEFINYATATDQKEANTVVVSGATYTKVTGALGTQTGVGLVVAAKQTVNYILDLGLISIVDVQQVTTPSAVTVNIVNFSSYAIELQIKNNGTQPVTVQELTATGTYFKETGESVVYQGKDEASVKENGPLPWTKDHYLIGSGIGQRLVDDVLLWHSGDYPIQSLPCRGDYGIELSDGVILADYTDIRNDAVYGVRRIDHKWDGTYENTLDLQFQRILT